MEHLPREENQRSPADYKWMRLDDLDQAAGNLTTGNN
jgi:hypothetical protein